MFKGADCTPNFNLFSEKVMFYTKLLFPRMYEYKERKNTNPRMKRKQVGEVIPFVFLAQLVMNLVSLEKLKAPFQSSSLESKKESTF